MPLQALFAFDAMDEDVPEPEDAEGGGEDHISALKLFTADSKGEQRLLKWLTKICSKRLLTLKRLPGFLARLQDAEVLPTAAVKSFYAGCDDAAVLEHTHAYLSGL
jgi:hypothetical protein